MIFLNESICDVEERKQQIKTKYKYLYQFISKSLDSYQIKFYSVYSRKFMQHCAPIVTGEIKNLQENVGHTVLVF